MDANGSEVSFRALARCLPEALLCTSTSGEVLEVNRPAQQVLGRSGVGLNLADLAREDQEEIERYLGMCYRSRSFLPGTLHVPRADGSFDGFRTWGVRLEFDNSDAAMVLLRLEEKKKATAAFVALNRELDKLNMQRRRLNKQRALIRKQKAELLEFTAPMIDVWEGVLLVPLFGVLTDAYFDRVLDKLLDTVALKGARWVVLDMTGTPSTSAAVTGSIVRIACAIRLLGASCILSGLGPELARGVVEQGGVIPRELLFTKNLHSALAMCLGGEPD